MSAATPVSENPSRLHAALEAVGAPFVVVGRQVIAIFHQLWLTLYYLFFRPVRWSEVVRQCYQIGNRSLFFVAIVLGFLGMILIFQSGLQAKRIVGDLQMLGGFFLQTLFREFAPTITALMLATRVGTGIAAEIGSMVVTEQVDALRMNNADPTQYLVVPRFIATVLMTLLLSTFGLVVSYLAGMFVGFVVYEINPATFYNTMLLEWGDLIIFVLKCLAFGIAVPIIAAEAGLSAFGGSEGVGWATTKSVVNASLAVTFLDFLLSGFGYLFLF
jgi:phospholipid/cholesterol/gamma-HCH transport system permease protein